MYTWNTFLDKTETTQITDLVSIEVEQIHADPIIITPIEGLRLFTCVLY